MRPPLATDAHGRLYTLCDKAGREHRYVPDENHAPKDGLVWMRCIHCPSMLKGRI